MAPALNTIPDAPADEAALLTKPSWGKGKCDIYESPRSQGAKSCKHDSDCSGYGKCSYCRQHSTSIHGHSWQHFCMNKSDEP